MGSRNHLILSNHVLCGVQEHTQPFNSLSFGTAGVGRYQKEHSPTHTHPDHWTSFINFFHLLQSIASAVSSLSDIWNTSFYSDESSCLSNIGSVNPAICIRNVDLTCHGHESHRILSHEVSAKDPWNQVA